MCTYLCGNQPTDRTGKSIWRKRYYNNHGSWPRTEKQQKQDAINEKAAKELEGSSPEPTVEAHPAVSSAQMAEAPKEDHVAKVVREWWARHPHLR